MPKAKPIPMDAAHSLPFDEIMRRALMLKPTKPKKASRPKGAKKKGK